MIGSLNERKVFVTGGSRGIGAQCVRSLVEAGAYVGFTYQNSDSESSSLVRSLGGRAASYKADSRDLASIEKAVKNLYLKPGPGNIWGLVINAGIYNRGTMEDITPEMWRDTLEVNLEGAYNAVKACLPYMDQGSIVMVSSQLAHKGSAHGPDYSASKAGLLGLARSLARDLAPGIRVNTVSPGYVDTDILSGDSVEKRSSRKEEVPLGRIGSPKEIADPIVFLLSDLSSYITGADIDINGGLYIH